MYLLAKLNKKVIASRIKNDNKVWLHWAANYHEVSYTMYDKTTEERRWLKRLKAILDETIPLEFKDKVINLNSEGCMGESVYSVDGVIGHTLHAFHIDCRKDSVLRRGDGFWCASCNKTIKREDALNCEEIKALEIKESLDRKMPEDIDKVLEIWIDLASMYNRSYQFRFIKESLLRLNDILTDLSPKEGIAKYGRGFIVNGKPAFALMRDCNKCRIPWHAAKQEEAVYDVWHKGAFEERKAWCAKCNDWTTLKQMGKHV
jgi:hypothetical protein